MEAGQNTSTTLTTSPTTALYKLKFGLGRLIDLLSSEKMTIAVLSSKYIENISGPPIWKQYKINFLDFIKKFDNIFQIDKNHILLTKKSEELHALLLDENFAEELMARVESKKSDKTIIAEKYGIDETTFESVKLQNTSFSSIVSADEEEINKYVEEIFSHGISYVSVDMEATITGTVSKTSIIQLGYETTIEIKTIYGDKVGLIHTKYLILQLSQMNHVLPKSIVELFESDKIVKYGVGIVDDINNIQMSVSNNFCAKSVVDLGELSHNLFKTDISCGLRDLAAIYLHKFLENKGDSSVKKTDWDSKILSDEQQEYAIMDVLAGLHIFGRIKQKYNNDEGFTKSLDTLKKEVIKSSTISDKLDKQNQKKNSRQNQKEIMTEKMKQTILSKTKKWAMDEDNMSDLVFEQMNGFFRKIVHDTAISYEKCKPDLYTIKSVTKGEEPAKYVVLQKEKVSNESVDFNK